MRMPNVAARLRRGAGAAAVAAGLNYLWWRHGTMSGTGVPGVVFFTVELISFMTLTASVILVQRGRRRIAVPLGPPTASLDVFLTVCGEPVQMVEQTLRSALAIEYPHRTYLLNDSRVGGFANWPAYEALASRLGVRCFTRVSGAAGKAANLNYALARTTGSVVATIDADHHVDAGFATETLGYFCDPAVGFVCTRQRFDVAADDPLYNDESFFYDHVQPAKDADNAAFSCGNGSLYRRAALLTTGGFSEWNLVEDLHTSYSLHAAGWSSRYHPQPLTTGRAPGSAGVYLSQRLRWATDSSRLLFWDNPLFKKGLSRWQRLHYLHTASYYALQSLQLVFLAGPPLYVFMRVPIMDSTSTSSYVLHAGAYFAALAGYLVAHGGLGRAWRAVRSAAFCGPVYLLATIRAVLRVQPPSRPTPKGRQRWFSPLVLPVLCCVALEAAAAVYGWWDRRPGRSPLALAWATVLTAMLIGPLTAVEGWARLQGLARRLIQAAAVAGTAAALAFAGVGNADSPDDVAGCRQVKAPAVSSAMRPAAAAVRRETLLPPAHGAYVGLSSPGLQRCEGAIAASSAGLAHRIVVVNWFQQWSGGETQFRPDWVSAVRRAGAVPMITWEPWRKPAGSYSDPDQPSMRLRRIAAGDFDSHLRSWARGMAVYGGPILLRPMHEMNGDWYPWSVVRNGNSPSDYIAAWRHLHDLFHREGATNVSWVWAVNDLTGLSASQRKLSSFYPGRSYVDWVALTGFNWGRAAAWGQWRDIATILDGSYSALMVFGRPIMVSETGTNRQQGNAATWVRQAMRDLPRYPGVKAVVWLDRKYSAAVDFRLQGAARTALSDALTGSYWPEQARISAAGGGADGVERPVVASDVDQTVTSGGR